MLVVGKELLNLRWCWRQADQIQRYASTERAAIGFWCWSKSFTLQASENESINRIDHPITTHVRQGRTSRRYKGPMRCPRRALFDPFFKERDLGIIQTLVGVRRGHARIVLV